MQLMHFHLYSSGICPCLGEPPPDVTLYTGSALPTVDSFIPIRARAVLVSAARTLASP